MRHSKKRHKLGVSGPHRLALLANLSVALITHGRIKTTLAKAKALRPFVEKVITLAKKAESSNEKERKLHFRRLAISRINDPAAVALLFDERVAEFMERPGGYTRIYKIGQRIGDAAEMGLIELIDGNDEGYSKRPSRKTTEKPVVKDTNEAEDDSVADETVELTEAEATAEEPKAEAVEESAIEADAVEAEVAEAEAVEEDAAEESNDEVKEKSAEEPSSEDAEPTEDTPEVDEADTSSDEKKESD